MATKHSMQEAVEALQGQNYQEASVILAEVIASQPGNFKARWLRMRALEQDGQFDAAQAELAELLMLARRDLAQINKIAQFMRQRRYPLVPVIGAYQRFLERTPGSAIATYNCAYYMGIAGQAESAIEMFKRALDLGIKAPEEAHLNIANLYMNTLHKLEKAREHLETALELNPDYLQAHFNMGNLEERLGDRGEAQRHFERCLEIDPNNDFALARLADAHQFSDPQDSLIARMAERAAESENADLQYSLGRAYDQVAAYDDAWPAFARANELDRAAHPEYRQTQSEALVRRIIDRCNADWLSRFSGVSHEPVFVCGMFRSGSTLLEQMLAAHPGFTAGGESEFFPRLVVRNFPAYPDGLEALEFDSVTEWKAAHAALCEERTGGLTRMTDKRPDNFLYVGLIKAILPSAKFVVTERDWRDVAVSVFTTRLGPGQAYATRLRDIRHYLELHRELIDHWERLLGDDLVRVSYEELVNEPRETIGALLKSLGEEWDDACLDFDKQEGAVATASVWQVRQPLNPKSIGRWKNYEKYFEAEFGAATDDD